MSNIEQKINTEFIRLDAFLKLTGFVPTGGQAKAWIQEGHVRVNNEPCTQRGRKLYSGDSVSMDENEDIYHVLSENRQA